MTSAFEAYFAQNKPEGRQKPKPSNKEFIEGNLPDIKKKEEENWSDKQIADAVAEETGRALSASTFRRYVERARKPAPTKARRIRPGHTAASRAADGGKIPGVTMKATSGPTIEHDPDELPSVTDLFA